MFNSLLILSVRYCGHKRARGIQDLEMKIEATTNRQPAINNKQRKQREQKSCFH